MPDLIVLAGNLHNERAAVGYLRRRSRADAPDRFDIGFVSEAHRRRRLLRRLPGHDYYTGPHRGPSQEVGILVDRNLTIRGESHQLASEAIGGKLARVGKERWGKSILTTVDDVPTAAITIHPVAGDRLRVGNLPPDHILVRRYTDAMRWLDAQITYHRSQGHEIVFGGDLQVTPDNTQPWSVYTLLATHGLSYHRDGIDLIAWSSGYVLIGNPHTRADHTFPSDGHPALRIELAINHTRRNRKKQP